MRTSAMNLTLSFLMSRSTPSIRLNFRVARHPTGMHRSAAEPVTGTTICRHYREDYKYCASQQYAAAAVAVGLEFLGSVEVLDQHEIAGELVELNEQHGTSVLTETHAKHSDPGGIRHHFHH